jgi:hypothetical protein
MSFNQSIEKISETIDEKQYRNNICLTFHYVKDTAVHTCF